jgi:hypothetical protein
MLVYHFTTAQFGLSNVTLGRIKVSRFSTLNDPFELLAIDTADIDLRIGVSAKKRQIDENEGLICFCRDWRDPVLWSHYGEKHRGVCLEFNIPKEFLKPVRYVKGLRKIDVLSPSVKQATIDRLLDRLRYTKFIGWKYENEVRKIVVLSAANLQGDDYFLPFSEELKLTKVILGPKFEHPIVKVTKLIALVSPDVQVIATRLAYKQFTVVKK